MDFLLEPSSTIVISHQSDEQESFIERVLRSYKEDLPENTPLFLLDAFSSTFFPHRLIDNSNFFYRDGEKAVSSALKWARMETDARLQLIKNGMNLKEEVPDLYILMDNFSLSVRAKSPLREDLFHILFRSRPANVHVMVFNYPSGISINDLMFFSSTVILSDAYSQKYRDMVPSAQRKLLTNGRFFRYYSASKDVFDI